MLSPFSKSPIAYPSACTRLMASATLLSRRRARASVNEPFFFSSASRSLSMRPSSSRGSGSSQVLRAHRPRAEHGGCAEIESSISTSGGATSREQRRGTRKPRLAERERTPDLHVAQQHAHGHLGNAAVPSRRE